MSEQPPRKLIIHWKGEGVEGYSMQFRHDEFRGALEAVLSTDEQNWSCDFSNALQYSGLSSMNEIKRLRFNQAMQYVHVTDQNGCSCVSRAAFIHVAQRCSLVHAIYEVVAEHDSAGVDGDVVAQVASMAIENGGFDDMCEGNENGDATWCVRLRHYGEHADAHKEQRHSIRSRSLSLEKKALISLKALLVTFGGGVDLEKPDCKIYVLVGLKNETVLTRRLAVGPQTSIIAPRTRICVTTTPLCPIAAYTLCNIAGLRPNDRILDPYAGSCTTLLAATLIEPSCTVAGIEVESSEWRLNRTDIYQDFSSRDVKLECLVMGDCRQETVRDLAKNATLGEPFDHIIFDPPYGIRESTLAMSPVEEIVAALIHDEHRGKPLLKNGGRMVCFVPRHEAEGVVVDAMPNEEVLKQAGLKLILKREQPLNDALSRWLVAFEYLPAGRSCS